MFVVAPIVMVVLYAFSAADGGFTLDNFARMGNYTGVFAAVLQAGHSSPLPSAWSSATPCPISCAKEGQPVPADRPWC